MNSNKDKQATQEAPIRVLEGRHIAFICVFLVGLLAAAFVLGTRYSAGAKPTEPSNITQNNDIEVLRKMVAEQHRQIGALREIDQGLDKQIGQIISLIEELKLADKAANGRDTRLQAHDARLQSLEERTRVVESALVKFLDDLQKTRRTAYPQEQVIEVPAPTWRK